MLGPDRPAISYSQRGNLRFELEVRGPKQDLHSGNFGGVIHNPLQVLCEIVASLHDAEGRVAVSGFYDRVREWGDKEREFMKRTGPKDADILRDAGVSRAWGEPEFNLYERTTIRPALTLNGIAGGYQGKGIKTVIPSRAMAKLSIRIVPDQDPKAIEELLRDHIRRVTPPTVTAGLRTLAVSHPALVNRNHPALRAAAFAYRKGFGTTPVFLRSGGSVPAASICQKTLGIPTVLMGFGLPDDRAHAPNEKFHLPNFFRGVETSIWYLAAAATMRGIQHAHRATKARTA
jgi:acetylornithine deacetylase/succinyl-diaminopimelate desuccinylase-like protein